MKIPRWIHCLTYRAEFCVKYPKTLPPPNLFTKKIKDFFRFFFSISTNFIDSTRLTHSLILDHNEPPCSVLSQSLQTYTFNLLAVPHSTPHYAFMLLSSSFSSTVSLSVPNNNNNSNTTENPQCLLS